MAHASVILIVFLSLLGFYEIYVEARGNKASKIRHYTFQETFSNLAVYNQYTFSWLLVIPFFFFYDFLLVHSKALHLVWPKSEIVNWLIALVATDFVFYIFHVLSHNMNLFWGAHLVHHQPEHFNYTVGGRTGFFEKPFYYLMLMPLALSGLPPLLVFSAAAFGRATMGWLHTETIGKLGPLEYLLNTPSHHRVHHYKDIGRLGGTKNYGGVFIIWDRIFGTFAKEQGAHEYGIGGLPTVYSPFRSNTFFYRHLLSQFFKVPVKDRLKLLFSSYLPEPISHERENDQAGSRAYGYYEWTACFLLLLVTYPGTHVLAAALRLINDGYDSVFFAKFVVASGLILLAIFQLSRFLEGKGKNPSWTTILVAVSLAALADAFFLQQPVAGGPEKNIFIFFLEARAFFAFAVLLAFWKRTAPGSAGPVARLTE